jgi:hypothetical protein
MKESEHIDPKTTETTLNQTEKKKTQPADRPNTDNTALNGGKEHSTHATPAAPKLLVTTILSLLHP